MSNRRNDNSVLFSLKQLKEIEVTNENAGPPGKAAAQKKGKARKFKSSNTEDTQSILAGLLDDTTKEAEDEKRAIETRLHQRELEEERKKMEEERRKMEEARRRIEEEGERRRGIENRRDERRREKELQEKIARGEILPEQLVKNRVSTIPAYETGIGISGPVKKGLSGIAIGAIAASIVALGIGIGTYLFAVSEKPGMRLDHVTYSPELNLGANVLIARVSAFNHSSDLLSRFAKTNVDQLALAILKKKSETVTRNDNTETKTKKRRRRGRRRSKLKLAKNKKTHVLKINTNVFRGKSIVK
ncbi:MAG: hypothetical protein KC609_01710 [Myxococcales bacterium]|nr:hypothetical protein [Myxococcales bacterium]